MPQAQIICQIKIVLDIDNFRDLWYVSMMEVNQNTEQKKKRLNAELIFDITAGTVLLGIPVATGIATYCATENLIYALGAAAISVVPAAFAASFIGQKVEKLTDSINKKRGFKTTAELKDAEDAIKFEARMLECTQKREQGKLA